MSDSPQMPFTVGATKMGPVTALPPDGVTTTGPVVAPLGTVTAMLVLVQVEGYAVTPLNVTLPKLVPRFNPAMDTLVPAAPLPGLTLVMAGPTTNLIPLLCS